MSSNQFLIFATDPAANVESQADYAADSDRTLGQQPGLARAELNNKAIRQSTFMVSQIAQYMSDKLAADVLDDGSAATLYAQVVSTFGRWSYVAKGTSYSLSVTTDQVVAFTAVATATLPTAVGNTSKIFAIVNPTGGYNVTINTTSAQTIGGAASGAIVLSIQNSMLMVVSNGANWLILGRYVPGASGTVYMGAGLTSLPVFSTATFPSTATGAGTILRADGTNWSATTATYPATTTVSQILYSSSANVIGGITTANTAALVTNSSGVPGFTSGSTANRVLRTDGTTITFGQVVLTTDVTGTLPVANGGTGAATRLLAFPTPTIQKFTSGSGTYTTPTSPAPLYIRVVMVGGGGGGGGAGTIAGNNAVAGNTITASTASTFGSALLSAGAGAGGSVNGGAGASNGGTSSLGTGPIGIALSGAQGAGPTIATAVSGYLAGGVGGSSAFGGAGGPSPNGGGGAGATNSGAGGAGGSGTNGLDYAGGGGAAGGYVDAIIASPSATYAYVVGVGGNGGAAGTSGTTGGAGGSGLIVVYEYYQ